MIQSQIIPDRYASFIPSLLENGPQTEIEYKLLSDFFCEVAERRKNKSISDEELREIRAFLFKESFTTAASLQGHVTNTPRGYHGDFEIIDKIYTHHTASEIPFRNWDNYFQQTAMPEAVRNRKTYFIEKLASLPEGARILNLASGPCRDLLEFDQLHQKHLVIDCVDLDADAIAHAQELLKGVSKLEVNFTRANIFRFQTEQTYDLVWSAGLFDYFEDSVFTRILQRVSKNVKEGGKMIIGNFRRDDATVAYMEFGEWYLHYRDAHKLMELSEGIACKDRFVEEEPLALNLFLNFQF